MNWINIHTDTLRSEAYLGADPVERATWLNLLAWCVSQENGGIIEDAEQWKDRKWQQVCGVTKAEVETMSELYGFENGNLMVFAYPHDKEAEVIAKREAGKKGGRPRKALQNKDEKPYGYADGNHVVQMCLNGREGKDKDKVREGEATRTREDAPPSPQMNSLDELKAKINALRPEWQKPAMWNYAEEQHLHNGAARQMAELDAEDWQNLARFFKAYLDNAKAFWRPNSRSKFVETFADVWASCQRWTSKHKPQVAAPRPVENVEPAKHDPNEYAEEIAEYKAKTGCELTPQEIADDSGAWAEFIKYYFNTAINP